MRTAGTERVEQLARQLSSSAIAKNNVKTPLNSRIGRRNRDGRMEGAGQPAHVTRAIIGGRERMQAYCECTGYVPGIADARGEQTAGNPLC